MWNGDRIKPLFCSYTVEVAVAADTRGILFVRYNYLMQASAPVAIHSQLLTLRSREPGKKHMADTHYEPKQNKKHWFLRWALLGVVYIDRSMLVLRNFLW